MKAYVRFRDHYYTFCDNNRLTTYSKKSVELWVVKLSEEGKSYGSILSHVSAIKFFCTKKGKKLKFDTKRLKLILRGIKNSSPRPKLAAALSYDQLVCMVNSFMRVLGKANGIRFSAMITCAFFGMMRPSEYCVSGAGHEILVRDISVSREGADITFTSFKHSKGPAKIRIPRQSGSCCPIYRLQRYLKVCTKPNKALFPITHRKYRAEFDQVIESLGFGGGLTPHSLRRGGASWASMQGWSDSRIRAYGRWSSNAFKKYVVIK